MSKRYPLVRFERLSAFTLADGATRYEIAGEPLPYHLFSHVKGSGLPFLVFGQGMIDRATIALPRFQRLDWAERLNANVLIINDPTLFLSADLGLGWCLGTRDYYVLPRLAEIVERCRFQLGIRNDRILFYGSSAGGFTSLMLASRFPGSSALVNNPQTDVLKFTLGGVRALLATAFGLDTLADAQAQFGERFSFVTHLERGGHLPRICYVQNVLDDTHFTGQMLPLVHAVERVSGQTARSDLSQHLLIELYSDPDARHNPAGYDKIRASMDLIRHWFMPPGVSL